MAGHIGATGSITAHATVSRPIGLVDISNSLSPMTRPVSSGTLRPFALLAPKVSGVIISIDGLMVDWVKRNGADLALSGSYRILNLPVTVAPSPQVITLIYSEN